MNKYLSGRTSETSRVVRDHGTSFVFRGAVNDVKSERSAEIGQYNSMKTYKKVTIIAVFAQKTSGITCEQNNANTRSKFECRCIFILPECVRAALSNEVLLDCVAFVLDFFFVS